jgi:hypothetical protein
MIITSGVDTGYPRDHLARHEELGIGDYHQLHTIVVVHVNLWITPCEMEDAFRALRAKLARSAMQNQHWTLLTTWTLNENATFTV